MVRKYICISKELVSEKRERFVQAKHFVVCVCVCVCERERERERESKGGSGGEWNVERR